MPKPTVVLAMIVKDESPIIQACLERVLPYVDAWSIVDTGSTDHTRELVVSVMQRRGLPGSLHRRPWVNFAHNRAECLELAGQKGADYALVLDADDEWTPTENFEWPDDDEPDAFEVSIVQGDIVWMRPQALRLSSGWTYTDPVHAIPVLPDARLARLPEVEIVVRTTGHRHVTEPVEKYKRDAEIYERLLEEGSTDPRHVFYCAQSHRDAGNTTKALGRYLQRAQMGGWQEEVWCSTVQAALLADRIGASEQAITTLLRAVEIDPQRAETFVELARISRQNGRPVFAHLAASAAAAMRKLPDRRLFVDRSAYTWRNLDEVALAAYDRGFYQQAHHVNTELLKVVPDKERARVEENLEHCAEKLGISTRPDTPEPRVLVAGAGRSGTGFLAEVMRRAGIESGHEKVYGPNTQVPRWRETRFESSWLCMPWLAMLPRYVRLVHLVRHPLANARSWMAVGMFDDDPAPGHAPYRRLIDRYAHGVLQRDTPLERWLAYWVVWNEDLCARTDRRCRIEDLDSFKGTPLTRHVHEHLGVDLRAMTRAYEDVPKTWNHRGHRSVTIDEVLALDADLVRRARQLCETFGYDLTDDAA